MSTIDVTTGGVVPTGNLKIIALSFAAFYIVSYFVSKIYTAFFGPLSKIPGPTSNALSIVPFSKILWTGGDGVDIPALHDKYGEVVRMGPDQVSLVGNAEVFKEVYGFKKPGQANEMPYKDPTFYTKPPNDVDGIMSADNATHSRQRKIAAHAFSDRALKEQEPLLKMWAEKLKDKLAEREGAPTDLVKMFNCTTFDVMADLTFAEPLYMLDESEYVPWVKTIFGGIKVLTRIRAVRALGYAVRTVLARLLHSIPAVQNKRLAQFKYTTDRVDKRLAITPDRPDLWSRILDKNDGPEALSLQEHYSIAFLMMAAGTETTATGLSGTLYNLLQNPQYLRRLTAEIRDTFRGGLEDMKLEPLARMPYLEAVLKEGLRVYPPIPTTLYRRVPKGGATVAGYYLPEGTGVGVHHLSTYRAASNFRDAAQFRPERWLDDPKYATDKLSSFEPFSVGPRNCLGKNLAWHEMRLILATVLYYFDVDLCDESQGWSNQKVYALWEKRPLMCRLNEAQKSD